jgi:ribonucleotide reductase alpha subunit
MRVLKRSGKYEDLSFDKVTRRIKTLCTGLQVSPEKITQKTMSQIIDGISTIQIDEISADVAANMSTEHPDYELCATRIYVSNMHKKSPKTLLECLRMNTLIDPEIIEIASKNAKKLIVKKDRDNLFGYFGLKTMEKIYLAPGETPGYMFMRVALGIHRSNIPEVLKTYEMMSTKQFIHATPTMINAGKLKPQMSSCFLTQVESDSITGIYNTLGECAQISKHGGGIGIHIQDVRASGSKIRGTNGRSDGIVPMLRVFNNTARYVNQCFTPETIVYTVNGPKHIDQIVTGDNVITIDGSDKCVCEIFRNHVNKNILKIRINHSFEPTRVTGEHNIYALTNQAKMLNFDVIRNRLEKKIIKPSFVAANTLKVGDYVGFPIPTQVIDFDEEPEFFRLYGIIIGDGHTTKNEFGVSVGLKKMKTFEFVKSFLTKRNVHYWVASREDVLSIRWSGNIDKIPLIRDMVYDNNKVKKIDSRFLNLPLEKQNELIKGLMETDGGITHEVQFSTTSKNVAFSMRYMMSRMGILSGGCKKKADKRTRIMKNGRSITGKLDGYSIRIPKHENLQPILGDSIEYSTTIKFFTYQNMLWSRIRTIETEQYEGYVYDLSIQDNHNYTTDMGLVHNSGARKGSFAVYLEPWHADIFDFLELRLNQGDEEARCRDLFTALWIPDLFMKTVESNGEWALFCPDEAPGLSDVYGESFEILYTQYVKEGRQRKMVPASTIWNAIIKSQIETGTPYMLYKDTCNARSNQRNLGTLKGSNLCTEIMEYTSEDEIAVCNLASISLPSFVDGPNSEEFDFKRLHEVSKQLVTNLNNVIDHNFYPVEKGSYSNQKNRPIGIGVQGLADVYMLFGHPFDSKEAYKLNSDIFETIYHGALERSVELARENGVYTSFVGSPASEGLLQFDLAGRVPDNSRYNWDEMRTKVRQTGLRNSLLLAPMPTATTSQVLGNNECFEPYTTNIYLRRTLAGEFVVVNKHLIKALGDAWTPQMKNKIIEHGGSIQNIPEISDDIKKIFKTSWELSQKVIIEQARDRGAYICQSQSMNLFVEDPSIAKMSSIHMYTWKQGLKTGMYYLRTRPKAKPIQVTVPVCRFEPGCMSCGS